MSFFLIKKPASPVAFSKNRLKGFKLRDNLTFLFCWNCVFAVISFHRSLSSSSISMRYCVSQCLLRYRRIAPSSLPVQRLPNSHHHHPHVCQVRPSKKENKIVPVQTQQLQAACCLIFYTYPILITLKCRLSPCTGRWLESRNALAACCGLSTAECLDLPHSQTDVAPSCEKKQRGKKKDFSQWSASSKHNTKCAGADILSARQESRGARNPRLE